MSSKLSHTFHTAEGDRLVREECLAPIAGEAGGARAIEVIAMLGDSVVGVSHCMDPRGGKVTRATWGIAAGALACLLASAVAFLASIHTAAGNHAAFERHTRELRPAYAFRPRELGGLAGGVAFGGLALGLGLAAAALVRARSERRSPCYRIGTAPGVDQALEGAPSERYPLVAPSGDDFVFNHGPGIEGELIAGGTATPLSQLAAAGQVSRAVPGAIEIPIPQAAQIRARVGQTAFVVSAVARPRKQGIPVPGAALEGRTVKYVAGSLGVHLAAVVLLSQIPIEDTGAPFEMTIYTWPPSDVRIAGYEPPPAPEEPEDRDDGGGSLKAPSMTLPAGVPGDPAQPRATGTLVLEPSKVSPEVARQQAIEAARMGSIFASPRLAESIARLTTSGDFSRGFDTDRPWVPIDGMGGPGRDGFGMAPGGGGGGGGATCYVPSCDIIGTGTGYTFDVESWGKGGSGPMIDRRPRSPIIIPAPFVDGAGGPDKSIIRRYVRQHEAKISYCYQKELLARPGIGGEVLIQFLIGPTGTVQQAAGKGFDAAVASCVAGVIKNIAFPGSRDGAPAQVRYPFTFRTVAPS